MKKEPEKPGKLKINISEVGIVRSVLSGEGSRYMNLKVFDLVS